MCVKDIAKKLLRSCKAVSDREAERLVLLKSYYSRSTRFSFKQWSCLGDTLYRLHVCAFEKASHCETAASKALCINILEVISEGLRLVKRAVLVTLPLL